MWGSSGVVFVLLGSLVGVREAVAGEDGLFRLRGGAGVVRVVRLYLKKNINI